MNSQRGKMTFMSLIAMVILAMVGYMAFKFIGTNLEKKQIKKEVFDTLGTYRGSQMDDARAMEIIENILLKHKTEILELDAHLNKEQVIQYSFKYKIDSDYLLFKRSEIVEVADEISNYM
ncbi:MAG: hypothetical protein PHX05_06805 [Acidobacteriota bacterium]|jgi:hypothetical protein|nr:hypothetical protein [Acidobacteriota bacterium]